LKYLLATSQFEVKNVKDSLKILYKLLLEVENKMKKPKSSQFDPLFDLINQNRDEDIVDAEDDFCDFTKKQPSKHHSNNQNDFGGSNHDDHNVGKILKKEKEELFGIFPP
jgi:hypothetical protein